MRQSFRVMQQNLKGQPSACSQSAVLQEEEDYPQPPVDDRRLNQLGVTNVISGINTVSCSMAHLIRAFVLPQGCWATFSPRGAEVEWRATFVFAASFREELKAIEMLQRNSGAKLPNVC